MLCMLRASLLYSAETYYNLKEIEHRQIERMEESFLRQLFDTQKGCPISQLYLEFGLYPARFEIAKMRLLFLQYILKQDSESLLYRFLEAQMIKPTKGCWYNQILCDLESNDIQLSFNDISSLSDKQFQNIVKDKISITSLKYLLGKQRSKGNNICYTSLKMSEYLLPYSDLTIDEKTRLFSIRNHMVNINSNFSKNKINCITGCNKLENMEHIYYCEKLSVSDFTSKPIYSHIYSENVDENIETFRIMHTNLEKYESLQENLL